MDVAALKTSELVLPGASGNSPRATGAEGTAKSQKIGLQEQANQQKTAKAQEKEVSTQDYNALANELNKFMDTINVDIKFAIHEKTKQMMVQVLDAKEQRVLREYPAHELLDTLAAIREYVGILLDKKA